MSPAVGSVAALGLYVRGSYINFPVRGADGIFVAHSARLRAYLNTGTSFVPELWVRRRQTIRAVEDGGTINPTDHIRHKQHHSCPATTQIPF